MQPPPNTQELLYFPCGSQDGRETQKFSVVEPVFWLQRINRKGERGKSFLLKATKGPGMPRPGQPCWPRLPSSSGCWSRSAASSVWQRGHPGKLAPGPPVASRRSEKLLPASLALPRLPGSSKDYIMEQRMRGSLRLKAFVTISGWCCTVAETHPSHPLTLSPPHSDLYFSYIKDNIDGERGKSDQNCHTSNGAFYGFYKGHAPTFP